MEIYSDMYLRTRTRFSQKERRRLVNMFIIWLKKKTAICWNLLNVSNRSRCHFAWTRSDSVAVLCWITKFPTSVWVSLSLEKTKTLIRIMLVLIDELNWPCIYKDSLVLFTYFLSYIDSDNQHNKGMETFNIVNASSSLHNNYLSC